MGFEECNNHTNRVLVTGSTGYIGSQLTTQLAINGYDTHIIIRPQSDLSPLKNILSTLTVHCCNGTTENMIEILQKANPDIVFHLASSVIVNHSPAEIEPLIGSNILFGCQLVEAMIKQGCYHLINTGTSWQHFNQSDYSPVNLYASTKEAFEAILTYYTETSSLKVTTLKLFDTYGPNDSRSKIIPLLQKAFNEQKELAMSKGEQLIDLVYIDDVVNAYMIAAERHFKGQCGKKEEFAISSENPIPLKEIVRTYEELMGKTLPILWGKRPYRIREVMIPWNRGVKLPNWHPKFDLKAGMTKVLFKEQREEYI
jgi:nucleoside-diphosphate-sugar epimerase